MTHHNRDTTVFDFTVAQQHLSQYKDTMYNPLAGNTVSCQPIVRRLR